jgi:hypothetical protein
LEAGDEYRQAMMRAEIDWLASVIAELKSKKTLC